MGKEWEERPTVTGLTALLDEEARLHVAVEKLMSEVADLGVKVVNLANKLEDHMKEADAHNPAMMHKKKY